MAETKSQELEQKIVATSVIDGKVKAYQATIKLASQASGDIVVIAKAKQGEKFIGGLISTDTSLGTSTVKIGTAADDDKYKADAVFTTTDTPTNFGKVDAMKALEANEDIILTVGTAALPASGYVKITMFFAVNN